MDLSAKVREIEAEVERKDARIFELEALLKQAADRIGVRVGTAAISSVKTIRGRHHWRARDPDGNLICGSLQAGNKAGFDTRDLALETGARVFAGRWKTEFET